MATKPDSDEVEGVTDYLCVVCKHEIERQEGNICWSREPYGGAEYDPLVIRDNRRGGSGEKELVCLSCKEAFFSTQKDSRLSAPENADIRDRLLGKARQRWPGAEVAFCTSFYGSRGNVTTPVVTQPRRRKQKLRV